MIDRPPPSSLPFLQALCWQSTGIDHFTPLEMLHRYERGWHYRGAIADPSPEETEYLRSLCQEYGSWLSDSLNANNP
jgi:hypothetical protein